MCPQHSFRRIGDGELHSSTCNTTGISTNRCSGTGWVNTMFIHIRCGRSVWRLHWGGQRIRSQNYSNFKNVRTTGGCLLNAQSIMQKLTYIRNNLFRSSIIVHAQCRCSMQRTTLKAAPSRLLRLCREWVNKVNLYSPWYRMDSLLMYGTHSSPTMLSRWASIHVAAKLFLS